MILCKQLVHMCNVEFISIWIWKYMESYCDNLFEICFFSFWKHDVSKQKHGILGISLKEILSFATKKSMTKRPKLLINYNNMISFQILSVKSWNHTLVVHLTSKWWHGNRKDDIIFSLQVFIHMAYMIDNKWHEPSKYHMKMLLG